MIATHRPALATNDTFERVAKFALRVSPADIPPAILKRASLLLLDTLGIAAASAPMQAGVLGRELAVRMFAAGSETDSARMLFDGRRVSLAGAVFAAATQTDNLDGHDGYNPAKGHIGVVAVPTLAALAEHLPGLAGRDALAALVAGYEIAGRAAVALHGTASDYHTSGAWNALGVAAMAARMRGMRAAQLREAFGIAEYHGPRSQMMREIANPTMLHDGSGWGALAGMSAAILAEAGFTGAPAVTIEDEAVAGVWADLGSHWLTGEQYIKPYPVCRWAHPAIDAARNLCLANIIDPAAIEQIRVRSFASATSLYPGMPDTTSKAQYSLPFAVAAMIVNGEIGVQQITGEALQDPKVARLVQRTIMEVEPRHDARFPMERFADIEITMANGQVLSATEISARGGPDQPYGEAEICAKFMDFATPALGAGRAEALRKSVLNLTEDGSRFGDVAALLYEAA